MLKVRIDSQAPLSASYPDVSPSIENWRAKKGGKEKTGEMSSRSFYKMAARVMEDEYAVFKISSDLFNLGI